MSKRRLNLPSSGGLAELDLVSYGRRGRHTPLQFSHAQLEQIGRTVRGVPEVMVKVSGGGKSSDAVKAHLGYIDRHGKLEVHTDEGERLQGKGVAEHLVDDWHLDRRERTIPTPTQARVRKTGGRSRCTTLSSPCPRARHRGSFSRRPRSSPGKSSRFAIAMPWSCTPTRDIRMCTWWSRP